MKCGCRWDSIHELSKCMCKMSLTHSTQEHWPSQSHKIEFKLFSKVEVYQRCFFDVQHWCHTRDVNSWNEEAPCKQDREKANKQTNKKHQQMLWQYTNKCKIENVMLVMSFRNISHTKHAVPDLFNVCKNHRMFTVRKNLKISFQFMILTHLWPWNKVKVIKPGVSW